MPSKRPTLFDSDDSDDEDDIFAQAVCHTVILKIFNSIINSENDLFSPNDFQNHDS